MWPKMHSDFDKKTIILVVSPGRSGQASFSSVLEQAFPSAYVAFEEPQIDYILPKKLSFLERKFRRKFLETDELLGRGKVLKAFENSDFKKLQTYGDAKVDWLLRKMHQKNANVAFEVNKHLLHGLHIGMQNTPNIEFKMIELVRNPLNNMRSFLNRNKNFYLDNSPPDCVNNELIISREGLTKGQLYLHAWCECYLRARRFCKHKGIELLSIRSSDLENPKIVRNLLEKLSIPISRLENFDKINTNSVLGYGKTVVTKKDVSDAELFWRKIPNEIAANLPEFNF